MTEKIEDIVIVGGGPAGSYLGYLLAKNGISSIIFDHSHPREKPCGGGISVLAIEKFQLLHEITAPKTSGNKFALLSPYGTSIMISGKKNSWGFSREEMDRFFLDKAISQGCVLVEEQVINVKSKNNLWIVETKHRTYQTKIIIGADGVNSIVRKKILGPIPKEDIGVCYGCFATSKKKIEIPLIKYYEDKEGYAWCFPRHDHLSIGVGMGYGSTQNIKTIFNNFISDYFPDVEITSKWGAKIPQIRDKGFYDLPCAGENWILIGDAAGHVDPVSGEGITYALWSAELAAQAIIQGTPQVFDKLWRQEYGRILYGSCASKDLFYNKHLLEITFKIASKSKTLSTLFQEMLTNQIHVDTFVKKLTLKMPTILKEYLFSKISR